MIAGLGMKFEIFKIFDIHFKEWFNIYFLLYDDKKNRCKFWSKFCGCKPICPTRQPPKLIINLDEYFKISKCHPENNTWMRSLKKKRLRLFFFYWLMNWNIWFIKLSFQIEHWWASVKIFQRLKMCLMFQSLKFHANIANYCDLHHYNEIITTHISQAILTPLAYNIWMKHDDTWKCFWTFFIFDAHKQLLQKIFRKSNTLIYFLLPRTTSGRKKKISFAVLLHFQK